MAEMKPINTIIIGAAGRDFHNFNVIYRDNELYNVVAFTATQIPNISGRKYPAALAGRLYPNGIPIYEEKDIEELIRKHISEMVPVVRGFHRLKTRKSGSRRLVEFHMLVDGRMSVDKSHEMTERLQEAIEEHFPDTEVTIHIEPDTNRRP